MEAQFGILLNVVIAAILTGFVGLERELKAKPAGFRTHMIVGGAAALLISLGTVLVASYASREYEGILRIDPIRIIEAIIVGISFIGAGTILQVSSKDKVLYLTTSASILFSSGIGIAVGLEQYMLAIGSTALLLIINHFIDKLEQLILKGKDEKEKEGKE